MAGSVQAGAQKMEVVSVTESDSDEKQREESVYAFAHDVFQRISNGHWRSVSEMQRERQTTIEGVLGKLSLSPRGNTHFICLDQLRALSPPPPEAHLVYSPPPNVQREENVPPQDRDVHSDLEESDGAFYNAPEGGEASIEPSFASLANEGPAPDSEGEGRVSLESEVTPPYSDAEEADAQEMPPPISRTGSWTSAEHGAISLAEFESEVSVKVAQESEPEHSEPSFEPQSPSLTRVTSAPSLAIYSVSEEDQKKEVDRFVLEQMHSVSLGQLNASYSAYVPDDYATMCIDEDPISDERMESFPLKEEQFFDCHSWATLKLGRCAITDDLLEAICEKNRKLIKLTLFNCLRIENPFFLRNCSELRELCLSWCRNLSPLWLARILEGTWPHLESLELANTPTTSEMLMGLPPLPLKRLDLSHCWWIDDPKAFVDLIKHPNLYWIRVEGAKISEHAINELRLLRPGIQIVGNCIDQGWIPSPKALEPVDNAREIEPFNLRRYMSEACRVHTWNSIDNLVPYKKEIEGFYLVELEMRNLKVQGRLDTPERWLEAEKIIQQHDRPNLSKMMEVLVPLLPKEGHFAQEKRECFRDFWEITCHPRLLNQICELDFSKKGLTEIPPCFWRLIFCRVRVLDFSGNQIEQLPNEIVELISAEEEIDKHTVCQVLVKRTYHFLSRYPRLKVLNFSSNQITSLKEVFPNGMLITGELEVVDFSRNRIRILPPVFGISPVRISGQIVIVLSGNLISEVTTLEELGSSDPVKITLDLRDNGKHLESNIPKELPANVDVKRGNTEEEKKEG